MYSMIGMGVFIFLNALLVVVVVWAVVCVGREQRRDDMRRRNEAPEAPGRRFVNKETD